MPPGGPFAVDDEAAAALVDAHPRDASKAAGGRSRAARPADGVAAAPRRDRPGGRLRRELFAPRRPALAARATGHLRRVPRLPLEEHARGREAIREAPREDLRRRPLAGALPASRRTSTASPTTSRRSPRRPTRRGSVSPSRTSRSSDGASASASSGAGSAPTSSISRGEPVAFWHGYAYNRTFVIGIPGYDPAYCRPARRHVRPDAPDRATSAPTPTSTRSTTAAATPSTSAASAPRAGRSRTSSSSRPPPAGSRSTRPATRSSAPRPSAKSALAKAGVADRVKKRWRARLSSGAPPSPTD